jgi:prepilin-type processing-associated H-X9-DG protein
MKRRSWPGFTFLELLVVVALLILLAGLLFPVFAEARDAARRSRCLANLHQLALAHQSYTQDYDDTLPYWLIPGRRSPVVWTESLRSYYQDPRLLHEGLTLPAELSQFIPLADYALCTWGPSGRGTVEKPYFRWPGSPWSGPAGPRMMTLAEVPRPAETLQLMDGYTIRHNQLPYYNSGVRRRHRNGLLNGAFLDGHACTITDAAYNRLGHDEHGYFYALTAADR